MLFTRKANTIVVGLYVLTVIFFAMSGAGKFSIWGLANWGMLMALLATSFYQYPGRYPAVPILGFACCLVLHTLFGETAWTSSALLLVNFMIYLFLPKLKIHAEWIGYLLLGLLAVNAVVGVMEFTALMPKSEWRTFLTGLFNNPNSTACFAGCAIAAVLLLIREKKIQWLALLIFLFYLVACKSRNLVLFTVVTAGMYVLMNSRLKKLSVWLYLLFFVFCLYFLIELEPHLALSKTGGMFGKAVGSSGRSHLLLLAVKYFPLTLWGEGVNMPNFYVAHFSGCAIHNLYVNTLFAMGCVYSLIYIIFVVQLYRNLQSVLAKAFFFGFHIYFMFEPGLAFGANMVSSLPLLVLLIKLSQEKNENSTLHPRL